jgi:hypothetical protein
VAVGALIALRAQSPDPKSPEFQAQERAPTKVEQARSATNVAGSSLLTSIGEAEDEAARYPRGPETGAVNDLDSMTSSGRWMVVATAGPNWGCFVLELG